jgi:SAM-dependent methyltransferase
VNVDLPDDEQLDQDEEWCEIDVEGGESRKIRFHDYAEIYKIPGLYEHLFYDRLECASPETVRSLLAEELEAEQVDPKRLTVLDLGAGNGMVAEQLKELGVSTLVGVDLLPEAEMAAERDRPGLYAKYHACDLTELTDEVRADLNGYGFNCLVTVAALGFGDIPPLAFAEAFNMVADGGWIAFNIKEDFVQDGDPSGFNLLIQRLLETGMVEKKAERVYRHRLSTAGEALNYVAIIGIKRADISKQMVADAER